MNLPLKKAMPYGYGRARGDLDVGGWLPPERQTFDLFSRHIELKTVEARLPG